MNSVRASTKIFFLGLVVLVAACGGPQSRVTKGHVDNVINQQPTQSGYLEAIGIGGADPALLTETQRKALSRDAAIVKAQYEMLSMVKGVMLEGGVTVQRALETDSSLEARVRDVIRGAEVLKTEYTGDNGCVVTIRLPKSRIEQMMGVKFK